MQTIEIGSEASGPILLDQRTLVDTRLLVCANSGGGKSWLLRLIAERSAGQVQTIILDPEGEFATLREKVDMALVGDRGELATDLRTAGLLARRLLELRIGAIIDLYDLKLPDRREYVRVFLTSLLAAPRKDWHPLLVILDEAHLFAPERSAGEAVSTEAVIALMSQGRKRGFAGILATQRLSKLHKDAEAECNNVIVGRCWQDVDQKRAGALLGFDKDARLALRDLKPGEFYGFGPALRPEHINQFKVAAVATPHPRAGSRHQMVPPQASAKVVEIVQQIGDLPKQVQAEADKTSELERQHAILARRVKELEWEKAQAPAVTVQSVDKPVFKDGEVEELASAITDMRTVARKYEAVRDVLAEAREALDLRAASLDQALDLTRRMMKGVPLATAQGSGQRPVTLGRGRNMPLMTKNSPRITERGLGEAIHLREGERKMLLALAQRHPMRLTKAQLGTLSGFTPSGGTYRTYYSHLARLGYIDEDGNEVSISRDGLLAVDWNGQEVWPRSVEERVALWGQRLRQGETKMLVALVHVYPNWLAVGTLGDMTGYMATGGTFRTYLGTLRRNNLALVNETGEVRASEELMG